VVVVVPSAIYNPANYKIKILFQVKFEDVNSSHTNNIGYYKLRIKYLYTKHGVTTWLRFVNANICKEDDSNGSKCSYGPVLHSHTWMPYS
jgi:hypothetical protein